MKNKLFLVKEIVARIKQTGEIEGTIKIPFPVKEIHKICHHSQQVRTVVGHRCIAYFGEIKFSIYFIHGEDFSLRLIEDNLRYKGFAFFGEHEFSKHKPIVEIQTVVLDAFAEKDQDSINITGFISTELILADHREISLGELQCFLDETDDSGYRQDESPEMPSSCPTEHSEFTQGINHDVTLVVTPKANPHTSAEVITHVYPGNNPDLIFTLED